MDNTKEPEKIACSAVWYKSIDVKLNAPINPNQPKDTYLPKNIESGIVFFGLRHAHCIYLKYALTGLRDSESGEYIQGFLTTKNRFVNRTEALEIAKQQNQIIDYDEIHGNSLYSENLY